MTGQEVTDGYLNERSVILREMVYDSRQLRDDCQQIVINVSSSHNTRVGLTSMCSTWNHTPPALRSPDLSHSTFKGALNEDTPVLDRRRHMRRLHDSGAGYNYLDLLTYLLTLAFVMYLVLEVININCKTTAFITTVENFLLLHE